ncbi:hypothetical protein CD798_04605 [Bacillaceae bacterium SAOS 7]|nr:hypothetical protein CD798_04605 [Bacillaceae bacterium SAOS 7]
MNEKRKALDHRRQAKDELAERLFFNLLDRLAFDLEPIAPGAGQEEKPKVLFSDVWTGALRTR